VTTPSTAQPRPRRGRGRPAKYAGEQEAGRRILVGFPADLLAELTAAAAAAGHSREDEIRRRCQALRTDLPAPTTADQLQDDPVHPGQARHEEDTDARLAGLARTSHRDAVLTEHAGPPGPAPAMPVPTAAGSADPAGGPR
jgi:hypothetical protein